METQKGKAAAAATPGSGLFSSGRMELREERGVQREEEREERGSRGRMELGGGGFRV